MIKDNAGVERQAPIFFVSPYQINYHLPPETATGPATIQVIKEDGSIFTENTRIEKIMPGLYSADSSGKGLAVGRLTRIKNGQVVGDEPIVRFNEQGVLEAVPIVLGETTEDVILVLFGTGLRNRKPDGSVIATIGGVESQILYAGKQPEYIGLDQINIRLSPSLKGRGLITITLKIDDQLCNPVQISVK